MNFLYESNGNLLFIDKNHAKSNQNLRNAKLSKVRNIFHRGLSRFTVTKIGHSGIQMSLSSQQKAQFLQEGFLK